MLTILLGIIAAVIGILWLVPPIPGSWFLGYAWPEALTVIKGVLSLGLVGGGLIAVAAGISSIKDKIATQKEDAKRKEEKKEEK